MKPHASNMLKIARFIGPSLASPKGLKAGACSPHRQDGIIRLTECRA
jgi:hypothetical protein